jgi:membrane-associated phospholipid phosphatase
LPPAGARRSFGGPAPPAGGAAHARFAPRPHVPAPPPPPDRPPEEGEWRDALLAFGPAILVAFVLDWALATRAGWPSRHALAASVAVGVALAVLLQRALARRRPR